MPLNHRKRIKAFTLIEILAVILTLAAVSGLAFQQYHKVVERMKERSARSLMTAIVGTLEIYKAKTGNYPPPKEYSDYNDELKPVLEAAIPGITIPENSFDFSVNVQEVAGVRYYHIFIHAPGHKRWTIGYSQKDVSSLSNEPLREPYCVHMPAVFSATNTRGPCPTCTVQGCPM